jgi:hypothetical protein
LWAMHKQLDALVWIENNFKYEDNTTYLPLIIFYQQTLQEPHFIHQHLFQVAGRLRRFLQAEKQTKQDFF